MRVLSKEFFSDFQQGILKPFLTRVNEDHSLCIELRDNYLNIYYRGGALLKLAHSNDGYVVTFDTKYFGSDDRPSLPSRNIIQPVDVATWLAYFPILKQAIDLFPKMTEEREAQQIIVRDNNFGRIARSTDYYICDIEYANPYGQFDIVAVHWPSSISERMNPRDRRLVLAEVKFGDGALEGTAGIHSHVEDVNKYLSDQETVEALKHEMHAVFNQKRALGLIDCGKDMAGFSDEMPIFLLILANHDPDKSRLREVLLTLPESPHAEVRIASASLLGYGLHDQMNLTVEEALECI
jgi:hypothetical protein